jgi:hypothetical protein
MAFLHIFPTTNPERVIAVTDSHKEMTNQGVGHAVSQARASTMDRWLLSQLITAQTQRSGVWDDIIIHRS